ncbi:kinase-like domain-containing protein [Rhizophagus clarus]|nr:kinase-like domain-containing protein [Rhizophagus clarus]
MADGIYSMPEGISQVLFVVDGRFKKEEINTFNMIKDSILEINILDYVTLVRTKFDNFRSENECNIDINKMKNESDSIKKIIESCNRVIHVDNPSVNIEAADDADDDDDDDILTQIKVSKKTRERSRKILLEYLEGVPPVKENYYFKLKTWDMLRDKINTLATYKDDNKILREMSKADPELVALYNVSKELCLIL